MTFFTLGMMLLFAQVTLEHMFQKIADQEKIIGQLQQTVSSTSEVCQL